MLHTVKIYKVCSADLGTYSSYPWGNGNSQNIFNPLNMV